MVLMDSLRVFDERERDKQAGQKVPSYEIIFSDVLPQEDREVAVKITPAITADILGLADLDRMENKIAPPTPVPEIFDPVEIHRQKIREILTDFPADRQEAFVAFLRTATDCVITSYSIHYTKLYDMLFSKIIRSIVLTFMTGL